MMTDKEFHRRAAMLHRELASLHQSRAEALGEVYGDGPKEDASGRLYNLKDMIRNTLTDRPGLTSAEIADLLYSDKLGMDRGTFRRRVIVSLSYMHKEAHELIGRAGDTHREKRWYLATPDEQEARKKAMESAAKWLEGREINDPRLDD